LVGIGHTYLQKHNCLIGTKISLLFEFISLNNPGLFTTNIDQKQSIDSIPMFVSIVYYKKEEWQLLMSQFDDSDKMHNTWREWRQATENGIEHMHKKGKLLIPVQLSADEIVEYCISQNLANTSKTRSRMASQKLSKMLRESKVI